MSKNTPPESSATCPFCEIARDPDRVVVLYQNPDIVAFLDRGAIRPGHTQIITRDHIPTFDLLPAHLLLEIATLGQQLARRMKAVYGVERVAFLFTGGDVPHVHAHVVPIHEKTDITSARYIVSPGPDCVTWGSSHLLMDREALLGVREQLAFEASELPETHG